MRLINFSFLAFLCAGFLNSGHLYASSPEDGFPHRGISVNEYLYKTHQDDLNIPIGELKAKEVDFKVFMNKTLWRVPVGPQHNEFLWRIMKDFWEIEAPDKVEGSPVDIKNEKEEISKVYSAPKDVFWVLELRSENGYASVIGGAGGKDRSRRIVEIGRVYLDIKYRGFGLGNILLVSVLSSCSEDFDVAYLETLDHPSFENALSLYTKAGFSSHSENAGKNKCEVADLRYELLLNEDWKVKFHETFGIYIKMTLPHSSNIKD